MHLDVVDLRDFYYGTDLGRAAATAIGQQVAALWEDPRSETLLGFGFAVPVMRPLIARAQRAIALMPGQQGVMHWPDDGDNISALCGETQWPLPSGIADRIMVMHALETSERPDAVLEECARVLAPAGRVILIVPNRSGLWARREATPFGTGRPYSLGQLERQLARHGLAAERHLAALFFPPSAHRFWLRSAATCEKLGRRISSYYAGGVILVEATKAPQRPGATGLRDAVRKPLRVREGVAKPA